MRSINPAIMSPTNMPPHSLGLAGDGDEIAAISEVEQCFGVQLDYSDAGRWLTVGDVFRALRRALPLEYGASDDAWLRFRDAISREAGVEPSKVTAETLLLGGSRFDWRLALLLGCLVGGAASIARLL